MKMKVVKNIIAVMGLFFASSQVQSAPWVACGNLSQMTVANKGTIPGKPVKAYEYGIAYNAMEPIPIIATTWNYGIRIYNKEPYLINSDNPANMQQGGFIFYAGTQATDDDCGSGNFRHQYWQIAPDNTVITNGTNGCYGSTGNGNVDPNKNVPSSNPTVYCRVR